MKFALRIVTIFAWVLAALFWLLSVIASDTFGWFNLNWALVLIAGISGICRILFGAFVEKTDVLKRMNILLGAVLLCVAAASVVFACALPHGYIWPIIAFILTLSSFVSLFATKARKWDEGDNHKEGYQNYRQRKASEQANKENIED